MSNKPKIYISLYSQDRAFQGYASHVSMAKQKVDSVPNQKDALSFTNKGTASKVCEKIYNITRGGLVCSIS